MNVLPLVRHSVMIYPPQLVALQPKGSTMAGYVTWKRSFPATIKPITWLGWGNVTSTYPVQGPTAFIDLARQTTTSYRTSGTDSGSDDDTDLLSATSQAEFRKRVRSQDKRDTKSSPTDTGNTFFSETFETRVSVPSIRFTNNGASRVYTGPLIPSATMYPSGTNGKFITVPAFNSSFYGPRAIGLTAPTNSVANLSTSLGELLREGIPAMIGVTALKGKGHPGQRIGGEYLNYEFGVKPLIKDVEDVVHAVSKASKLLAQYQRDSGRIVRRKHVFPEIVTASITKSGNAQMYMPDSDMGLILQNSGTVPYTVHDEIRERIWFSGAYSYYLQTGSNHLNKLHEYGRKVDHLLGARITADTAWNLAPWSWLADWVGNVGDNIKNAELLATDGLVIRWGYLMRTTTCTRTVTMRAPVPFFGPSLPPQIMTHTLIRKERIRATPFGFSLNPSSFTGRQWAILAALGMTRTPNSLRLND